MLKIVYPICCGIDVHKTFIIAVIAITDNQGITQYYKRRFSTYTHSLNELKKWLEAYSCFHVCMESTGKYWIPIYNVLEDEIDICLAHPKYVKAIRGKKTDKKDAQWIADLYKHDLVSGSFIPPAKIRQLRDLFRYYMKLTYMQTSEKNRYQNSLTWSNIQIASVVSDVFGKSSQKIIQHLLDNPNEEIDLPALIHRRMKASIEQFELAIDGEISDEQAEKLRVIKAHYDAITFCKNDLQKLITELGKEFEHERKLIQTVPGFQNEFSALRVIAEIGTDMSKFPTAKHLSSWAGVCPACDESANKKHSTKISKGGHYLKPLLVQVANAVVRSDKYPEFKNKYLQLKKRRGHKKAIIAIARKLLVAIYHVVKNDEVYNPELYHYQEYVSPKKTLTVEQAVRLAINHGYQVI